MKMTDDAKPLLTLNTHSGLYQLNRLGFGVASAPALWQKAMDEIFHDLPHTECLLDDLITIFPTLNVCWTISSRSSPHLISAGQSHHDLPHTESLLDDLITTGMTDEEHLNNLERILQRCEDNGLRLNANKCKFFQSSVEYCGHVVRAQGILLTDHAPLTSILSPEKGLPKMSTARLQRYAMFLSGFQYSIQYRESSAHANADCLSRLPLASCDSSLQPDITDVLHMQHVELLPVSSKEVALHTQKDALLSQVYERTQQGWPSSVSDPDLTPFFTRRKALSILNDCLMWGPELSCQAHSRSESCPICTQVTLAWFG